LVGTASVTPWQPTFGLLALISRRCRNFCVIRTRGLDVYTRAISVNKREANNRVMEMVFAEGKTKKGADRSSTLVSTLKEGS